jgi:hypothetical protein
MAETVNHPSSPNPEAPRLPYEPPRITPIDPDALMDVVEQQLSYTEQMLKAMVEQIADLNRSVQRLEAIAALLALRTDVLTSPGTIYCPKHGAVAISAIYNTGGGCYECGREAEPEPARKDKP